MSRTRRLNKEEIKLVLLPYKQRAEDLLNTVYRNFRREAHKEYKERLNDLIDTIKVCVATELKKSEPTDIIRTMVETSLQRLERSIINMEQPIYKDGLDKIGILYDKHETEMINNFIQYLAEKEPKISESVRRLLDFIKRDYKRSNDTRINKDLHNQFDMWYSEAVLSIIKYQDTAHIPDFNPVIHFFDEDD